MRKAAGVKKPSESQESEGPVGYEGSLGQEVRNTMIQLAKKNILGRKQRTLELWEEHLKDPITALDKALRCLETSLSRTDFRLQASVAKVA